MKPQYNVALDVDQVLVDFDNHWRQCAEEVLGREVRRQGPHFHLQARYGLSESECRRVWDAFRESEWPRIPVYCHAADLVYALEDLGCTVWAVSSIDDCHHAERAASLAGLIPAARIVCVGQAAHPGEKADVLRHLGAVAFLDDHPANANAAADVVNLSAMLNRGYEGLEAPEYGVTVIDDPMDFPVLVEQLLREPRKTPMPG